MGGFSQEGNQRIFPPLGEIEWVQPVSAPPFRTKTRSRSARLALGMKYEKGVHKRLAAQYGDSYRAGPWFCYKARTQERRKYCQLDGILTSGGQDILLEIKYSHCSDAFFQLTNLYLPIMQYFYPQRKFALVEVVKWYDPAVVFPTPVTLLPQLHKARAEDFSVHILNR